MAGGIKRHRRRAYYVALLMAFAALGVWASYALAGTKGGQVVVNVEKNNGDCGATQGKKVIGTDTLKQSGDTLSVVHKVHGEDPGTYDLYLYDGLTCGELTYLGKYKVDGTGDGSKSNSADVAGTSGQFYTCAFRQGAMAVDCGLTGKTGKNQFSGTITVTVTT